MDLKPFVFIEERKDYLYIYFFIFKCSGITVAGWTSRRWKESGREFSYGHVILGGLWVPLSLLAISTG